MKRFILVGVLFLAGCTSDNYAALPGIEATSQASILENCRQQAYHAFFESEGHVLIPGGLLGGVFGGVVSGAALGSGTVDKNALIAACMRAHGFEGHSEG